MSYGNHVLTKKHRKKGTMRTAPYKVMTSANWLQGRVLTGPIQDFSWGGRGSVPPKNDFNLISCFFLAEYNLL